MQPSRLIALLNQQRAIVYIGLATFLFTLGQGTAIPIVPLYGNEVGLTAAQIGGLVAAFAGARVFTNVPSAMASDRIGRKWVLIAGGLFAATGNLLTATSDDLYLLMAYRFIAGIGSGAFITVAIAATADLSSPENRARLMSFYQWSFIAGITLGPTVGGVVAEFLGIEWPFYFVGIFSTMSAIWTLVMVPETRVRQSGGASQDGLADERPTAPPGSALTSDGREAGFAQFRFMLTGSFLLIMLIFIGVFFTRGGALFNLLPLIARNDLGLSETGVGVMQTVPAVASLLVLPLVGAISDRYGRKSIIVPGMGLFVLCLAILGYGSAVWLFGIGMFLYGIAQGMQGPVPVAYVSDLSPANKQAMAQGMARTQGDIALMGGAYMLGAISDTFGNAEALLGTALAMGVIMVIFLLFARETAQRRRAAAPTGIAR